MTKSKATKLVKIIHYFANEWPNGIWEAKLLHHFDNEWKIEVTLNNSAYQHELNALMMLINNCVTSSVYLDTDDNGKIFWKIW